MIAAILLPLVIIAVLILINGLFVAAEFSIIGVRPSRIEQLAAQGNRAARWVQSVLADNRHTDRYIATAQLGITLASLGLGMYAEPAISHLLEEPLHDWFGLEGGIVHTISFIIALGLVTYLHIVLGEMVPKSLALHNTERTVLTLSKVMRPVGQLFAIPVRILNYIGLWTLRLLRIPPPGKNSRLYSLDELELIVSESYAEGLLAEEERELLENLLDFAGERVEQVMTPRPLMQAVPAAIGEEELLATFETTPYSRLPVYRDSIDDIIGVVHLKDLVRQQIAGRPFDLEALLHPVAYVPATLPIKELLARLKRQHQQLAIVMDEHGGTLGLVTMEDILEEVVGEVRDEFDREEEPLTVVAPGHLLALGTVQLSDLDEYVVLDRQGYDVHTVGGLVWALLGRRPQAGDEVSTGGATLRVEEVEGLTIRRVSIRYPVEE
ncbi:MAG TPA: HlyC/CorC family transporter [Anaerolineae bacterium]|nr:HlyC/CorC family transporter [Anaerolineae bacterium]